MKGLPKYIALVSLMAPLTGHFEPGDGRLQVGVAGGAGSFVESYFSCSARGSVGTIAKRDFQSYGAFIQARVDSVNVLGVRAGTGHVVAFGLPYNYVNPYYDVEWPNTSLGLGIVVGRPLRDTHDPSSHWPVSGHVRLGNLSNAERIYLSASLMESFPMAAGSSPIEIGAGWRPNKWLDVWGGTGFWFPYDGGGLIVRSDVHATSRLTLGVSGRLGRAKGRDENSISAGLAYSPR